MLTVTLRKEGGKKRPKTGKTEQTKQKIKSYTLTYQ